MAHKPQDAELIRELLNPLDVCREYTPKFGQSGRSGFSLEQFSALYSADPFYSWVGLDSPLVYAAHKAAGGITSMYRQLGVGCERLFRRVLTSVFSLEESQVRWSYVYPRLDGSQGVHRLDAAVMIDDIPTEMRPRMSGWIDRLREESGRSISDLKGAVFEVRQGYKSADSKRQNADLRFGMRAFQEDLLPVFVVFSNQISEAVAQRYRADGMVVLTGIVDNDAAVSTFGFANEVLGFDLASFFQRNAGEIREAISGIAESLLTPD